MNTVIKDNNSTAPEIYRAFQIDANGKLVNSTSTPWVPLPAGATDIGDYILYRAYQNTSADVLSGALDLSSLTTLSGVSSMNGCFTNCTGLTSVNLSSLSTLTATGVLSSCFYGCTGLTSVDLSALTAITANNAMGSCFYGCTGLISVSFPLLKTISSSGAMSGCFTNCTSLTTLSFPALTNSSFGTQTNQFNSMLSFCSGVTVHFPSNIQAKVETLSGYSTGFNGTNTTILFDLPPTE